MKKFYLFAVMMCFGLMHAQAWTQTTDTLGTQTTDTLGTQEKSANELYELYATYNSTAKLYGVRIARLSGKNTYFTLGLASGEHNYESYSLGWGLGGCTKNADSACLLWHLYPYVSYYSMMTDGKTKHEFTWGAAADVAVGLRVYKSKKGWKTFLTAGYYLSAPELDTKNLFDNGCWGLGLVWYY